jgi:hypothetical protein
VFRQGYDAGWIARSNGALLTHVRADGLFNAYYVGTPGLVEIEFAPRSWAIAGEIISLLSGAVLCIALLVLAVRRRA